MLRRAFCSVFLLVLPLIGALAIPAAAQVLSTGPQPMAFPVLAGASFTVDPHTDVKDSMYSLTSGALQLRATDAGWVDMDAYCKLPDRHWGPVSIVSCTLEVSGGPSYTGLVVPAHVALDKVPMGSTITLRLLAQAPLIVLDLEGNPHSVLDTFLEEYHWTLNNTTSQPPVATAQ